MQFDWCNVIKGATFAAMGAGGAYLIEAASHMDFGQYTPFVGAALAVLSIIVHNFQTHMTNSSEAKKASRRKKD